jgi:amidase
VRSSTRRSSRRPKPCGRAASKGPLFGATILLEDNIDATGFATTAGSLALAKNTPAADAPIVRRLRAAGGVVLGKTNLSEWANIRSVKSTSGWSSFGGQTRGVHGLNPCGSSSGSGVAVAAGLAAAALGTETDGSIVCPAAVNGIVGFKPTVGLVSRHGIVPISETQDTAGPMTRSVADAARILGVIAGRDDADPATSAIPKEMAYDFEASLTQVSLKDVRLGVVTTMLGDEPALDAIFVDARRRLEAAGATLVEVELLEREAYGADELYTLLYEFRAGLNLYLASHARDGQPKDLAELIAFNGGHADRVMPHFGQDLFLAAQSEVDAEGNAHARARIAEQIAAKGLAKVAATHRLDAFIAPTGSPAWPIDYEAGDQITASASGPAAIEGAPHLTVPMGKIDGRPVGLSFFGPRWSDARLLALGYAFLGR